MGTTSIGEHDVLPEGDTGEQPAPAQGGRPLLLYRLGLIAALLVGARLFLIRRFDATLLQAVLLAIAGILAWMPWTGRLLGAAIDRVRRPGIRTRLAIALVIWAAGSGYLFFTAYTQHRSTFPQIHDENAYRLQARMLATGRLWMPQHPMADFFETFFVLTKPVYAPIYFPGTAMLYLPNVRLHPWIMPVCAAGLCLALLYLITTAAIDGAAGLVAPLLLLSVREFRTGSVMFLSQIPALLLGLACVALWLAWQRRRRSGWLVLIGIAMGWAAITRPVDAVAFALPVAYAIARDLWRTAGKSALARGGLLLMLGAAPLLGVQLAFDFGTTGRPLETPYSLYIRRDQPGMEYGFPRFDPSAHPDSRLPQKKTYFEGLVRLESGLAAHRLDRLPAIAAERVKWALDDSLGTGLLVILLPAALLALTNHRRRIVAIVFPLFVLLYLPNPFYLRHYSVPVAAIVAFCLCLAATAIGRCARSTRGRRAMETFAVLALLVLAVTALPEIRGTRGGTGDAMIYPPPQTAGIIQAHLATLTGPTVVLFRTHPGDWVDDEPVYNTDVAWPDDARVIRARDLGPDEDMRLVDYYAQRQPSRLIYLYDAHDAQPLHRLGRVTDRAAVLRELQRCYRPPGAASP
jgi:hypothetical protein